MGNFFPMEEFNNLFFEKKKLYILNLGLKLKISSTRLVVYLKTIINHRILKTSLKPTETRFKFDRILCS